jgi:hypothetical protein
VTLSVFFKGDRSSISTKQCLADSLGVVAMRTVPSWKQVQGRNILIHFEKETIPGLE